MTQLYLCEKPSQARDIAAVLGANKRHDGYLSSSSLVVTWCIGHLLEMSPPDAYDPALKRWSLASLPILPEQWQLHIRPQAKQQFNVIKQLLKTTSEVIIATDADREGEVIAREVLALCKYRGPIQRLWLSALDPASIKKALGNLLPGEKTEPLYQAGLGRARADWLVGMNLTRACTVLARSHDPESKLCSVGRVQTPTLKLVVDRDRLIENFVPVPYFEVIATFGVEHGEFNAKWRVPKVQADSEGRCLQRPVAETVIQRIQGQTGIIEKAQTERIKEPPPLPYDLSTLQQEASRRFGFSAQQVLELAQTLYETHKATTYPRTDCPYLPESQHAEAAAVIEAFAQTDPAIRALTQNANPTLKSRAWNDSKITAHHAIIPTAATVKIAQMKDPELKIYDLIRRRYLAQFYPAYEFDQTKIDIQVDADGFHASGRVPKVRGWRAVIAQTEHDKPDEDALPPVTQGESAKVLDSKIQDKQTTPPARYTEGTLIAAMKHVAREITDPKLKQVLKDTAGIGTEATRAGIIKTLFDRQFLEKDGKKALKSTIAGRALIDSLPDPVKEPATTALWEQALEDIAQGQSTLAPFLAKQGEWVRAILQQIIGSVPKRAKIAGPPTDASKSCPACGKPMRKREGKNGTFYGCSSYPDCRQTLAVDGRPQATSAKTSTKEKATKPKSSSSSRAKTGDHCPKCKNGKVVTRTIKTGVNAGKEFHGCTGYPKCDYFAWARSSSDKAVVG